MMKKIAVIGAGSWGTALAKLVAEKNEYQVKLWVRQKAQAKAIKEAGRNIFYLPEVQLPESLEIVAEFSEIASSDLFVLAVPSKAMREICGQLKPYLKKDKVFVSCTKGLEAETFLRMSEVVQSVFPSSLVCAMSGPNHAVEVAAGQPTATVIACQEEFLAGQVQQVFTSPYFRPYTNNDIVGVELGGALKNIIALALGMLDGLGYQDNIKAATMTRGLAEITRLGLCLGAKAETFLGLAGMGDLISTCTSKHSRNRWAGELLAQGNTLAEITGKTNMVIEGVAAIQTAFTLAKIHNLEMPITSEIQKVLTQDKQVKSAIVDLMLRDYKAE